jgi:hypothetical protein
MRAYRLVRAAQKKKLPKLEDDTLQDDLMILFGPDLSPQDAIASLSLIINHIKVRGLTIGRDSRER